MGGAIDDATASVSPKCEHVVRGLAWHRTEIGMPPKTGPTHLWQYPSVLEQAVTLGWQLGRIRQWSFRGEPRNQPFARSLGRGGVCLPPHGTSRWWTSRPRAFTLNPLPRPRRPRRRERDLRRDSRR